MTPADRLTKASALLQGAYAQLRAAEQDLPDLEADAARRLAEDTADCVRRLSNLQKFVGAAGARAHRVSFAPGGSRPPARHAGAPDETGDHDAIQLL